MKKPQKQIVDPNADLTMLLKKLLALQLFAMGVPQGLIAKKVNMATATVNAFLKGIKKHAKKAENKS